MTSRSLCFKLMREDLKRRVWTIALSVLGLVFTLLVPVALKSSAYLAALKEGINSYEKAANIRRLVNMLGINGAVIAVLLVLAVVWAVSGFHYLHISRQVDFYHSIPVKRHVLFLSSYFNGLLVPAAIYLVIQAGSAALILRTGIGASVIGTLPWKMFLLNTLYYAMIYTTAIIAVMMTGNLIISLLGTLVFLAWGPAVTALIVGYRSMWFHTICETTKESMMWMRIISNSSPFANYMSALEYFQEGELTALRIIGAVIVTILLTVLAGFLYRIRPSEAAGRAMAFSRTQTPIKLLIALPVAVVFGIFFYQLRSTLAWGIFGSICGSFLTCCLMEIIYHFDFRKLLFNWIQMAACGAVSVLLLLAGIYDWYGFDSYLPKATDVKSASVNMGYTEDWVTYGQPRLQEDYQGRTTYSWNYVGQREYQYENMELSDIYSVMELAKRGVDADRNYRKNKRESWQIGLYDNSEMSIFVVHFRLNNGREVRRLYRIPLDMEGMRDLMTVIHDSKEYKKGTYPILLQSAADTSSVYFQQYNQVEKLELDSEERARLLAIYQKELEELTMETRKKEVPAATIQFRTLSLDQAVEVNRAAAGNVYEGLENRCFYPIYPSFTRTLAALQEAGVHVSELNGDVLSEINIQYYAVLEDETERAISAYEEQPVSYVEKEDIDALAPALLFRDYMDMNAYYEADCADNVYVTVVFAGPRTNQYQDRTRTMVNCRVDLNLLSQEEVRRFGFLRYEDLESESND